MINYDNIDQIALSGQHIKEIKGLKMFQSLRILNLSNNPITLIWNLEN